MMQLGQTINSSGSTDYYSGSTESKGELEDAYLLHTK